MNDQTKVVMAGVLFVAWGGLVVSGMTPAEPFVSFISAALVGLGVFHTTLTKPGDDK